MKQLIIDVLEDMSNGQINLASEAARKTVANTIVAAIKTNKKGWFLDIGTIDGKPKLTEEELETQRYKEFWICGICGKDTSKVEYDGIGSGTNHLMCELEMENADEDARTMPDGLGRAKELAQEAIEEGMRRTKNDMQLEHEEKVFDTAGEEVEPVNSYFTADVKDERDLEKDYIYESPDGGETIYRREFGSDEREEIKIEKVKK